MPRPCQSCIHPRADELNEMLVSGRPAEQVAKIMGLHADSVRRHRKTHLPAILGKVAARVEAKDAIRGSALYDRLEAFLAELQSVWQKALDEDTYKTMAVAREIRMSLKLLGELTGELRTGPQTTVNLIASPDWIMLRTTILDALAPYPDALVALTEAFALRKALGSADVIEGQAVEVE